MTAGLLLAVMWGTGAHAQKPGGVLRIYHRDSPASMSIHEEGTNSVSIPMMAVFNNLVLYDQHVAQNSLDTINPDLAESWSWNEDETRLTFKLREGVKWHDAKPFTSADVKCTWDLLTDRAAERLRANPRKSWWNNVAEIATYGPTEATFVLKRPQPAILALIGSGYTPIYPCHVSPRDMRQHPIGTGPFKFVEFKPNESIKLIRNPNYWKPGRPYLDGIDYTIIPNRSTAILAFIAGKFDLTFPYEVTVPLLKDIKQQAPLAICDLVSANASTNLLVNREAPPFPICGAPWRWLSIAGASLTSSPRARVILAGRCCRRRPGFGVYRPILLQRFPAIPLTSRRTVPRHAKSGPGSAMGPIGGSRSKLPHATSRPIATRRYF
jgi:peptide/nickel transport system substrate-binding protein